MAKRSRSLLKIVSVLLSGTIFTVVTYKIFDFLYEIQKSPFIDEIFHVPQAKLYCENQWTEWNPKITTLPGLYIVSYVLLKPFEILRNEDSCSVYSLRLTNLVATVLNFFLVYKIISQLEENHKVKYNFFLKLLSALNIAIFPPLYFFTFLYYTDVWSTAFVLLMYYLHLSNGRFSKILGALAGFMAVMMRQTNVIWVGLMIIDDSWKVLSRNMKNIPVQDYTFTKKVIQVTAKSSFKKLYSLFKNIISRTYHNLVICFLFIFFIAINKSIVLGDKDAHTATFHPMQNLYFLSFAGFFTWPFLIPEVVQFRKKPSNIFLIVILLGVCAGLSETNKLEHPYLLADNRHLAFYLWRRIFGHSIIRRLLIPAYVGFGILLWRVLQKSCHFMFMVALSLCIVLNLTPQYLFELRYFILPFIMCRIHFRQNSAVILETLFFLIINFGVMFLFANKFFYWPSEPNIKQRLIW